MEAVLRFAPAPVLSRFWEAGAQALKTVRNLFAAKLFAANPAREDAQADVNARAAEILDTHGNAILRYAYSSGRKKPRSTSNRSAASSSLEDELSRESLEETSPVTREKNVRASSTFFL